MVFLPFIPIFFPKKGFFFVFTFFCGFSKKKAIYSSRTFFLIVKNLENSNG